MIDDFKRINKRETNRNPTKAINIPIGKNPWCCFVLSLKKGKKRSVILFTPRAENCAYMIDALISIFANPTCSSDKKLVKSKILLAYPISAPI